MQREVADRPAFDFNIHGLLRGPAKRFVDGNAHNRHDQAIAEFIRLPDRADCRHSTDDHAF